MKQAIMIVAFGTTVPNARQNNINPVVERIRRDFPDYDVYLAFTSRIIVKRLRDRGEEIDTGLGCMEKLLALDYEKIIVQPLHLIGGEEFDKLKNNILSCVSADKKIEVSIGRPLLYFMGQEERPDDYKLLIDKFISNLQIPSEEGLLFIGHGGNNVGNASYAVLQLKLWQAGYTSVRLANLESYPTLEDALEPWHFIGSEVPKILHIHPLLLVAGDHVLNDIFGEEEESITQYLLNLGYEVTPIPKGLGEYEVIQEIYSQHVADAINHKYEGRSKDRPAIPNVK